MYIDDRWLYDQEDILDEKDDPELKQLITKCREEEEEHHDIGIEQDAEKAPGYFFLTQAIKAGCRTAIWLSKRF